MKFQSGDICIYSYKDFNYQIKLIKGFQDISGEYWEAYFLENLGPRVAVYQNNEIMRLPSEYIRKLTPLEQLI